MAEENSSIIPVQVQVQVRVPQDLQEEVQVRLPVRSLLRFKSVCKTWRSIIQSRPFIALYGQHRPRGGVYNSSSSELQSTISWTDLNKMVPGLNLEHECKTLKTKPKDGERQLRVYYVFGPLSNGVYCLTAHSLGLSSCSYYVLSGKIALCNPATREYKFADPFPREFRPMLSDISSSRIRCRLHLGFGNVQYKINSSSSEESLDYRIVALIQYGRAPSYSYLAFVYSVQRREWKKIVDYEPGKRKVGEPKATDAFDLQQGRRIYIISYPLEVCTLSFFKGCCHWTIAHRDVSFSVLLFNVADQSFSLLGGPPNHMDYVTDKKVYKGGDALVLHDHLAFIRNFNVRTSNPKGMQTLEIGVWMMMEYGVEESWTRIYKINPSFNGFYNRLYGIDYEEEEEEECRGIRIKRLILQVRLDDYKEEIISCDKAGHQVIRICDPEAEFDICWNTPGISTYIETLERL